MASPHQEELRSCLETLGELQVNDHTHTHTTYKMVLSPLGMLLCCDHTRAILVCHQTMTKYERFEERVCAYLFPSVLFVNAWVSLCVSVSVCVRVSWHLCPVYELLSHCAGLDPTGRQDGTDRGPGRKWASFLSSHCCIVVGAGRLVLRWACRGNSGGEWGGRWREASVLVAVMLVPVMFPQLMSACWAYGWCIVFILQYGRKGLHIQCHSWRSCIVLYHQGFCPLNSVLSQKINNTRLSYFKLAECPLGIFSSLWENAMVWEPGTWRGGGGFQSTLSLLLEWIGWHCAGHEDEKEEEEEGNVWVVAEVSLGLCFWCRVIAARMLTMCT